MAEFGQFLQDPRLLGFALQTGLGMMQPPAWGDTFGSQFARSVGQGAEAVGREEAMSLKEQDVESKAGLREAQAGAAEARAGAAGARAGAAADRLGLERERLDVRRTQIENQDRLGRLGRLLQAQRNYQVAQKQHESQQFLLPKDKQRPMPGFREYLQGQGLTDVLQMLEGGGDPTEIGGAARTPTRDPEARGTGLPSGSAEQYPRAVLGQTNRPPGIYNLNGSPARWDGKEWERLGGQ